MLSRRYRLKRRRLIRPLFDRTRADVCSVGAGCLRLVWRFAAPDDVGQDVPLQVGFAPGRRVRRAVDRNRIKRLMRTAFQQHAGLLAERLDGRTDTLTLMVLYRSDVGQIERVPDDLPRALRRLVQHPCWDEAAES